MFDNSQTAPIKNVRLFMDGAHTLFLWDFEAYRFTYRPVYQIMRRVLANYRRWSESVRTLLPELWSIWAAYCFFYERKLLHVTHNLKVWRAAGWAATV